MDHDILYKRLHGKTHHISTVHNTAQQHDYVAEMYSELTSPAILEAQKSWAKLVVHSP